LNCYKGPKARNGLQEGPGDKCGLGVWLGAQTGEMGDLVLQRGELPNHLKIVCYSLEDGHLRVRESYGNERIQKNNQMCQHLL